jgi:hypothetical protein
MGQGRAVNLRSKSPAETERDSWALNGTARWDLISEHAGRSTVGHLLDAEEVRGSNPLAPTGSIRATSDRGGGVGSAASRCPTRTVAWGKP